MARTIRVSTPLPDGTLLFESMTGEEGLSRPFRYEVHLLSKDPDLDMVSLLGQPMVIGLDTESGTERQFGGLVSRIALAGTHGPYVRYVATLRPWLWMLSQEADCRIFQNMTVPDIAKQIFREGGFQDFEESLSGTYKTWEFSVQYRESDLNYISRLLEQEGIYYYFKHQDDKQVLVLADSPSAHATVDSYEQVAYFAPGPEHGSDSESIHSWHTALQVRPGAFATSDFDFERPKADLSARLQTNAAYPYGNLEVFDYPGEYISNNDGQQEVRVRLEELQAEYEIANGSGTVRGIGVGDLFSLTDFPRTDQNRQYLIVTAIYTLRTGSYEASAGGDDEPDYQCSFSAIDSQINYRPRQMTSKPSVDGPQTAIVVGQAGEEIWTDQYGRVKVQFHWDREGKSDENSSCWVRVSQTWAGSKWGTTHIPRIGQEVIVDFLEGDPDRPIITGRVYNADNMPPYDLPANQTQSGIKSRSTKGGAPSNFNEIRFEDKKGSEEMHIQAEKNQTIKVKQSRSASVGGADSISVGGDRSLTVNGNLAITVKGGGNSDDQSTQEVTGGYRLHATDRVDIDVDNSYIKLKVGSSYIEITQDTITLHAAGGGEVIITPEIEAHSSGGKSALHLDANAKMSTTGNATVTGAVLLAHGDGSATIEGKTLSATGTDTAELHSKDLSVTGDTKTVVSGGGATITETASGVDVVGSEINLNG